VLGIRSGGLTSYEGCVKNTKIIIKERGEKTKVIEKKRKQTEGGTHATQ
jgi:hypothetical protein